VCSRQGAIQIHVYLTLPYLREDASGDREDGEEDDDELPCVIGESEGDYV